MTLVQFSRGRAWNWTWGADKEYARVRRRRQGSPPWLAPTQAAGLHDLLEATAGENAMNRWDLPSSLPNCAPPEFDQCG